MTWSNSKDQDSASWGIKQYSQRSPARAWTSSTSARSTGSHPRPFGRDNLFQSGPGLRLEHRDETADLGIGVRLMLFGLGQFAGPGLGGQLLHPRLVRRGKVKGENGTGGFGG